MKCLNCAGIELTESQKEEIKSMCGVDTFHDMNIEFPFLYESINKDHKYVDLRVSAIGFFEATKDYSFYVLPIGSIPFMVKLATVCIDMYPRKAEIRPFLFSYQEEKDNENSKSRVHSHYIRW